MAQAEPSKTKSTTKVETPLMKQYMAIKDRYPDALLLFRVGDFYETFGEDAIKAAGILGIVLTKRANGAATYVELAGFPHHSLDTYLPKLVRAGQRVAICDQLEDPKLTKTIVKRGVTELITPGVSYNDKVLDHKNNTFLACVTGIAQVMGIAFLDVSTGEFYVAQGNKAYIDKLMASFKPSEVLYPKPDKKNFLSAFGDGYYSYGLEDWVFTLQFGREHLTKHFNTVSLKGFGIEDWDWGVIAAGAVLHYLADTQHDKVKHINAISRIEEEQYLVLDKFTARNLELFGSNNDNAKTLISVIDRTSSPMGSRLLKRWLALPLKDIAPIERRHAGVLYFTQQDEVLRSCINGIEQIGDLERLVSKLATAKISPKEVAQLKRALKAIGPIRERLLAADLASLNELGLKLNACIGPIELIEKELQDDPPFLVQKGNVVAQGVNAELDELRAIAYSGKDYLNQIQQRESAATGISSLKIAYNSVFGYYLEVTNSHKDKVPTTWIRKQTLTNAERYITEELKVYEEKIMGAEERIFSLETQIFNALVLKLSNELGAFQQNATIIAQVDCLISLALAAKEHHYVQPKMTNDYVLDIKGGRHPVIELQLPHGEQYVSNDVYLDQAEQQIIVITGPNMAGKSALLRQTALIVLMAQMGSFVPADTAHIGLVDKIFTRVGASDNLSSGESTFMVEMNETASILNNVSDRSLILLDEIGRGTSTYDGISIAWAIVEYLHNHPKAKAKTLFATHYHELNDLAGQLARVKNYTIAIKEVDNKILFLRKLIAGGSEHSFGIHVAQMAGMPKSVIDRAGVLLKELEKNRSEIESRQSNKLGEIAGTSLGANPVLDQKLGSQLSFFQLNDPVLEQIRDELAMTDINQLSPLEALVKLNKLKQLTGG